jgi:gliding motility-associated-like protein
LDSTYTPDKVDVTNNRDNTYLVEYTISKDNEQMDRPNIPISIVVSDGLESVDAEHIVSLDNVAPLIQGVRVRKDDLWFESSPFGDSIFSVDVAFANGDTVVLETVWDGDGYDLSADFSAMDSTYSPGDESVEAPEEGSSFYVYLVSYELSSANKMADGEDLTVVMTAVDAAGSKSGNVYVRLDLDNTAPEILSVASADKDSVYKNGDTIELTVKLDATGYMVSSDFSALDSTYPDRVNEVYVTDNGDGTYTVKYGISKDNTLGADKVLSNLRITITVTDAVGNTSSDSSMVVELDNIPPELEIESPESDALVFEARIEVKGRTERDATVTVTPKGVLNVTPDVPVDSNGKFSCPVALDIGYNTITVTAADVAGNLTTTKLTILYQPLIRAAEGGAVYLPEKTDDGIPDNDTKVVVPAGAAKQDFSVQIVQLESPPPAVDNPAIGIGVIPPLVAYEFTVKDESGDQEVSIAFVKPIMLYLQYQELKALDVPAIMCRWDGVKWNRIGGEEDRDNNTVKATVNAMSIFGLFRGTAVTEFSLGGAFPNPFTPNDDGVNDIISFYVDNPNNAETVIRIFDLRGALIRKLGDGLTSWDGLDDAAQPVEMGVYIFQVEVEGQVKGGTIALAK